MFTYKCVYICLNLFKFGLSSLNCKPFIFSLWNSVLPNPSVNNFPVSSHSLWLFKSTVDSIFRTITAFCAYPENGLYFPHSSVLDQQSDRFFYRFAYVSSLTFCENNVICCLFKSSSFLKHFQFPADMSDSPFYPSSFPDSLFSFFQLLDKQCMLWVVVTSWFFWLTYLGIGSCSSNNQGQAAPHRRVLMWIFPIPICCLSFGDLQI